MLGNPCWVIYRRPLGKREVAVPTPIALLDRDIWDFRRAIHVELRLPVGERNVNRIVFQIVDVVAGADISLRPEGVLLEIRIAGQEVARLRRSRRR